MTPTAKAAVVPNAFVDSNGLMWATPTKVTKADLDDQTPSIKLDYEGNANIVYQQSGTDYMWAKVSPPGQVLRTDKRLATGYIPTQYQILNESTPQPTEFFDIGYDGMMHIVWTEAGLLDNKYQKFSKFGEPETGIIPMNQITDLSRLPYLGVGGNGRAYIAFENEGTAWVQVTFVDQEGLLRAPALIGRPGENVAFAIGSDGNMHLFYRSLGADARLFHVKLDPDRSPLVPVRPLFQNGSAVANAFSSMPNMAITSNGHVHILMSNTTISPHPLYYMELDENGTPLMDFIKVVDGALNYGDIAGEPDNGAYIAWDDAKDGEVHYLHVKGGVPGKAVTLTETHGKARHPQICSDWARGDINLAYVDMSSGQGVIYYRYANAIRIAMHISDLERALWVHPGGNISLDVIVTNFADLPLELSFDTKVDYHGNQGHGWSFVFPGLPQSAGPGNYTEQFANLKGPMNGTPGEYIDVSITVTPDRAPDKALTTAFRSTLVINHSILLYGPSRLALNTEMLSVPMYILNYGDVQETVDLKVGGGMPGWSLTLDRATIVLGPGGDENLELNISLPDGVAKDALAPVSVIARSVEHPQAMGRLDITAVAYPTTFIEVLGTVGKFPFMYPGDRVTTNPEVSNRGSSDAVIDLKVAMETGQSGWTANVKNPRMTVPPGLIMPMEVQLQAPADAVAGPGPTVRLDVFHDGMSESILLMTWVWRVGGLKVSSEGDAKVQPGETAAYPVTIENQGNYERRAELSVLPLPAGWKWQYGDEIGLSALTLAPYSKKSLRLFVTPPFNAPSDRILVEGTVTADFDTYRFYTNVTVGPTYNFTIVGASTKAKAALGSEARFNLTITNTGTVVQRVVLLIGDLPSGVSAHFQTDGYPFQLFEGRQRTVTLVVKLPASMNVTSFSFWASATSIDGARASVELSVELMLPDLSVFNIQFNNKGIRDGDVRTVTVWVQNKGDGDANGTVVELDGARRTVNLPGGDRGPVAVDFSVTFNLYDKQLVAAVDPDNTIQERNETNIGAIHKTLSHHVDVGEAYGTPGFDAPALIFVAIIIIFFSTRFRKRP